MTAALAGLGLEAATAEAVEALARTASFALGLTVRLVATSEVAPEDALTARERERLVTLGGRRRASWLRGRAALKRLLRAQGEDEDTSALVLPHRRFSLSHTRGLAVAAGVAGALGVGVDLEERRFVRPEMARFFLAPPEEAGARDLLRLWTVKEALFKADVANAGRGLYEYVLEDAECTRGDAQGPRGLRLRYASYELSGVVLSLAVVPSVGGAPCRD